MKMTIQGTLTEIGEVQTFQSGFSKREFRIDNGSEKYPNILAFQLKKDRADLADGLKIGQQLEIDFYVNGREYNERVYHDLDAVEVRTIGSAPAEAAKPATETTQDEMPF
jgi:hypothetical protein